jgi:hypothetical protein
MIGTEERSVSGLIPYAGDWVGSDDIGSSFPRGDKRCRL